MMMMMVCVLYEAEKSPTTCGGGSSVGKTNSNSVDYKFCLVKL